MQWASRHGPARIRSTCSGITSSALASKRTIFRVREIVNATRWRSRCTTECRKTTTPTSWIAFDKSTQARRRVTMQTFPILSEIIGTPVPTEGVVLIGGQQFVARDGVLRASEFVSPAQAQTSKVFGYKWHQRETFESANARGVMRDWLRSRYGDPAGMSWLDRNPILVDIGCGAARSSIELFSDRLKDVRFIGADISSAVDVAAESFRAAGLDGEFIQCDLNALPFREETCDAVFSEGVLHHTDSTQRAFEHVARVVKRGGYFLFYVYRRKGPV